MRRSSFSMSPPLPGRLCGIRHHFDHGCLAKMKLEESVRERKEIYIFQLSVLMVFAKWLASTSLYLSNLIQPLLHAVCAN